LFGNINDTEEVEKRGSPLAPFCNLEE